MSKRNNFFGSKTQYTARTTAFLAATGISDTTIANALNTMDLALIANGLDTKILALYPFVGGTATTHKYNFMNPADTDAAFRITWSGGITHSATGVLFNGSTGWGETHLAPRTVLADQTASAHISSYIRTTTVTTDDSAIGFYDGTFFFSGRIIGGAVYSAWGQAFFTYVPTANNGFFCVSRQTANLVDAFQNATQKATSATTFGTVFKTSTVTIGCTYNTQGGNNQPTAYSSRETAFATIGEGLSDTDESNLYTLIQNFQIANSRNV